jgi:superfamily II DNA/RNA helicase
MIHHEEPKEREEHEELHYFIRRQSVLQLLRNKGIKYFFPIQYETYDAINYGNDIVGRDRTGSGKTMAYSLPILERLRDQQLLNQTKANPKFIIILPTRELAIQVTN